MSVCPVFVPKRDISTFSKGTTLKPVCLFLPLSSAVGLDWDGLSGLSSASLTSSGPRRERRVRRTPLSRPVALSPFVPRPPPDRADGGVWRVRTEDPEWTSARPRPTALYLGTERRHHCASVSVVVVAACGLRRDRRLAAT